MTGGEAERSGAMARAASEAVIGRLRPLMPASGVREQRMFGGIAFMIDGNMAMAVSDRGLLVRVGKAAHAAAVSRPGASPMVLRGSPVEGYVRVETEGLDDAALADWVRIAIDFVQTLPAKPADKAAARKPVGRKK